MEIAALFNLRIDELLRYRQSRLPAGLHLSLALFLWTASLVTGWPATAASLAVNLVLAGTLVLQFRLWDDLNDVARDRIDHPRRVLCQATSLSHFRLLLAAIFALNVAAITLLKPGHFLVAFLILNMALFLWYRVPRTFRLYSFFSYHVVLVKYPVFVYLLGFVAAGDEGAPRLFAMALVYLCFCVYEVLHDERLRRAAGAVYLLAGEMAALAVVATLMFMDRINAGGRAAELQGALAIAGTAVLVFLFQRHRARVAPGRWCYAVFLIGFTWLLNYSFTTSATGGDQVRPPASIRGEASPSHTGVLS